MYFYILFLLLFLYILLYFIYFIYTYIFLYIFIRSTHFYYEIKSYNVSYYLLLLDFKNVSYPLMNKIKTCEKLFNFHPFICELPNPPPHPEVNFVHGEFSMQ